jgi:glycerol uptake operon antiterminator
MDRNFYTHIHDNPIIAAVNNIDELENAISSPCKIVFLLTGDILNIEKMVDVLRKNDKLVYIHVDLIGGLSRDTTAIKYINNTVKPDGIITTKNNLIKAAKDLGMFTIQRLFLLDSLSLDSGINSIKTIKPDVVEILPGIVPKIIREIREKTRIPVVAGGLIRDKADVIDSLNAGAIGISTSNENVWYM